MPGQYVQLKLEDIGSFVNFFCKQWDPSAKTHQTDICEQLQQPRLSSHGF